MQSESNQLDAVIIGGGPAGLATATYLARYRRKVVVVDSNESRAALIPATHNYPGFADGIAGPALLDALRRQVKTYDVVILSDRVVDLQQTEAGFLATTPNRTISAARVVLATGLVDRNVAIPGLKEAVNHGAIRYCPICDGYEASDQRIGVLGDARDAAAKALFLRTYSKEVTLLTLNGKTDDEVHRALSAAGIGFPAANVRAFERRGDQMVAVLSDGSSDAFDIVYPVLGCDVRSELALKLGARHNAFGCLDVDAHQQTRIAGLYAAGDVVSDLHQIAVATGHAAVAATHIHNALPHNYR
jgi:thioredoxin reductase (NADPH)